MRCKVTKSLSTLIMIRMLSRCAMLFDCENLSGLSQYNQPDWVPVLSQIIESESEWNFWVHAQEV